jgi:hypothetical protein
MPRAMLPALRVCMSSGTSAQTVRPLSRISSAVRPWVSLKCIPVTRTCRSMAGSAAMRSKVLRSSPKSARVPLR